MSGRVVHCKREKFDVYIGRPSKWGNPFPVPSKTYDRDADPERILERYEAHVRSRPDLMAALPELRGKVLACWCAPKRCHGDVLLRLVAELPDEARTMPAELTLEEWGALKSARDDGAPPKEAAFPKHVYNGLVARGLMRQRVGRLHGHGLCDFYLTTPAGEAALKDCKVVP